MSWSYNTNLTADKDKVRLLIGDTDTDDQQLSNEELVALISLTGSVTSAAIRAARALSAKYARQADKWVGDLKILASQKSKAYSALAEELEDMGSTFGGSRTHQQPFAGGISVAAKAAIQADTDAITPSFTRGLHDSDE